MKLKHLSLALLASMAFIYSACKKSSSGPTLDAKTVTNQVALNLSQSLFSNFGGFNFSDGLTNLGGLGLGRNQVKLQMTKGGKFAVNATEEASICGLHLDTNIHKTTSVNGTEKAIAGRLGITFNCTNNAPVGFTVTEDLTATATGSTPDSFHIVENLTLAVVNLADENSNVSVNGTVTATSNGKAGDKTTTESYNYTFNQVVLSPEGVLTSGSIAITTTGTNATGHWNYSGTATFIGNNRARVVINGQTTEINILSGKAV